MKWDVEKPRHAGKATGTVHGVPFEIEIATNPLHSQRTTWSMNFEIYGEKYRSNGQSGGVQRALSCLREDLDAICRNHGIDVE